MLPSYHKKKKNDTRRISFWAISIDVNTSALIVEKSFKEFAKTGTVKL